MSNPHLDPQDVATIRADDELLDLLGAGGTPESGDEVSAMLAAWRADIVTDAPPTVRRAAPAIGGVAMSGATARSRGPLQSISRRGRVLLGTAAAAVLIAGTVTVLANDARPGSPLWPITRVLYADWASAAVAEQDAAWNIEEARQAITEARYADAHRLLDEATALVDKVADPSVAQRLREEIAALRGLIPGAPAPPTSAPPGGTAAPTTAPGILPTGILPTGLLPPLPTGLLPTSLLPPILP
jgi:hypothetical protein